MDDDTRKISTILILIAGAGIGFYIARFFL